MWKPILTLVCRSMVLSYCSRFPNILCPSSHAFTCLPLSNNPVELYRSINNKKSGYLLKISNFFHSHRTSIPALFCILRKFCAQNRGLMKIPILKLFSPSKAFRTDLLCLQNFPAYGGRKKLKLLLRRRAIPCNAMSFAVK